MSRIALLKEVFGKDETLKSATKKKIIYVDIDGTICTTKGIPGDSFLDIHSDYSVAKPIQARIGYINSLYEEGKHIVYWTARGCISGVDHTELTKKQLKKWGAKYHGLEVGNKPHFDMYICDKSYNSESFFQEALSPKEKTGKLRFGTKRLNWLWKE